VSDVDSRLGHCIAACRRILERTAGGRAAYDTDPGIQDSVQLALIRLGEGVSWLHVHASLMLDSRSDIPWSGIRGQRDVLAHRSSPDAINPDLIWRAVEQIPGVLAALEGLAAQAELEAKRD
jgi:uncharacterized protein with HEPN domain